MHSQRQSAVREGEARVKLRRAAVRAESAEELEPSRARGHEGNFIRSANMLSMSVTLDVSRLSGWLKADAYSNMWSIFVTRDVSHLEMSALKLAVL